MLLQVALVQVAESRLQGAIDVISRGKVVVTNRLHAAIMANLIGRPLIWIDTQQHKLSGEDRGRGVSVSCDIGWLALLPRHVLACSAPVWLYQTTVCRGAHLPPTSHTCCC